MALLLGVIARHDPRDAASLPVPAESYDATVQTLAGMPIAFTSDFGFAAVSGDVRAAFGAALQALTALGAELIPDDVGLDPEMLERIIKPIAYTEQAAAVSGRDIGLLQRSDEDYRRVIELGRAYSGVDYVDAVHRRTQLRGRFLDVFKWARVLVTPTVAVTAFAAGTLGTDRIEGRVVDPHLGWSPFSWPINLAGLPALTLPCGFDPQGLPIGLQIIAPWLEEGLILRVAAALEAALGVSERRPLPGRE